MARSGRARAANTRQLFTWTVLVSGLLSLGAADRAAAEPQPGDVFREYVWSTPPGHRRPQRSQEVFSSTVTYAPKELPPNPKAFTNHVVIDDLDKATRAEVSVEMWSGHSGTGKRRFQLNGGAAIALLDPAIPDARGQGGAASEYQWVTTVTVPVPLAQIRPGLNSFKMDTLEGKAPAFRVWGVIFRVYYAPDKLHPTGRITSPAAAAQLGDHVELAVTLDHMGGPVPGTSPIRPVVRVDYFGHYEDFAVRGDGANLGWQGRTLHGEPEQHLGSALRPPFAVKWDTRWVPDQTAPMKLMARLTDATGLATITPVVEGLTFGKRSVSVKLYKAQPQAIGKNFKSRAGALAKHGVEIPDDVRRARAAKLFLASWSGTWADAVGVNGHKLAGPVGSQQNALSLDVLDVPVRLLKKGVNEPYVLSSTEHHGIDVLWPGMEIKVQFPARGR